METWFILELFIVTLITNEVFSMCSVKDFRCASSKCIKMSKVCDNHIDCEDGDDESTETCRQPQLCSVKDFRCASSKCIKMSKVCDNHIDCEDGDDESTETCRQPQPLGELPQIIEMPTEYKVRINHTICLPCKIKKQYTDHRKCLFYWKKDGSVVLQWPRYRLRPNKCLRIRNIRSSDHAKYVCYAKSEVGTAHAVRNLIVLDRNVNATDPVPEASKTIEPSVPVPPFFRDTLKRTAVLIRKDFYIGMRAKLKCAITGSPPPKIKWFHNGVSLEGSTRVHIRPKSYALIINPFKMEFIGNYTCVASNGKGVKNMTFIVTNKSGDPNPTTPVVERKTVKEGDNITLRCEKPASKVTYLLWDVKKELRKELRKEQDKGRRHDLKKLLNDDGTVVKNFFLYNVTRKKHAGNYTCLAWYRGRSREAGVPVKVIHLRIKPPVDYKVATLVPSPNNEILLVKIAVPVMGGLLTLLIVVICFRCRRKASLNNPVKPPKPDDEDDTLSMQILPNVPTGTLRIHKSLQELSEGDPKFFGELVILTNNDETNPNIPTNLPEREKCDKTSTTKKSPSTQHSNNTYQNNHKPYTKSVSNGSCYSIPESNTSKKYSSDENINPPPYESINPPPYERQHPPSCEKQTNIENIKKHRHKRRRQRSNSKNDEHSSSNSSDNNSNSNSYNSAHCGVIDDNIPPLEIPESPEEEDRLLQREMKNWEPLIRDSTPYICDRTAGDGDSLRYDRTDGGESHRYDRTKAGEGETTRLFTCKDSINMLPHSDCPQHIIL